MKLGIIRNTKQWRYGGNVFGIRDSRPQGGTTSILVDASTSQSIKTKYNLTFNYFQKALTLPKRVNIMKETVS
jgi:hypothetical protein